MQTLRLFTQILFDLRFVGWWPQTDRIVINDFHFVWARYEAMRRIGAVASDECHWHNRRVGVQRQADHARFERRQSACASAPAFGKDHQATAAAQMLQRMAQCGAVSFFDLDRKRAVQTNQRAEQRQSRYPVPGHISQLAFDRNRNPERVEITDVVRRHDQRAVLRHTLRALELDAEVDATGRRDQNSRQIENPEWRHSNYKFHFFISSVVWSRIACWEVTLSN